MIHKLKVDSRTIKLKNTDLPHDGKVILGSPIVQERGKDKEIKVYATCTEATSEPGMKYACWFSMRGKHIINVSLGV